MDNGAILYFQYLNGDESALTTLVQTYGDGLVRFAYCFVKDAATAEDIAEDTFATLILKRKRFSARASFKTYLYKIARNKCLDCLRFRKRFAPLDDLQNVLYTNDVNASAEVSERSVTLYRCMQDLPAQYRNVLMLVYIEEFSVAQAATIMGRTVKQTYNLLSRAKLSLKTLLINQGLNYEDI